ncbi:hypothetical protein ACFYXH_00890 [Streptomyces sp. NPDC002730]|uniref:hypothetical protein n=1 Tax=Streptomyces sp. NPDC002730 TaxID=3364662 RepID=UPI00367FDC7A
MNQGQIRDRVWAILATIADDRYEDVDALLVDLNEDDLGHVVSGLAALAVGFLMPRGTRWQDTGRRSRAADALRAELLHRAAEGPHGDDVA